ncbi:cytochrome c551 [Bacillus sp. REN16]|uniref:cytochrome c551 n=1 Tax=Bacillus sp. REN16 TaxID=2887296 RepID=UPI001E4008F2|nr:cytochrome c [Bacillus sp. REN16]MCC3356985.1 cytochrome c [Bacillus sp. REN16]
MKRKLFGFLLGTTLVFALAACGGGDDDNAANEPAGDNGGATTVNAEEVAQQNCASCHGKDLAGGAGPDLTKVGSKYSQDEIAGIIENGQGAMPGGLIKGEEKDAVAAWLAEKK